ncbi:MAG: hypothetical protein IJ647_08565 [Prevotella sp.]|nr:hypothetical protein [Prevotella sp.]
MRKVAIISILLLTFLGQTKAQHAGLTRADLKPVQLELNNKLTLLCKYISTVGNSPSSRTKQALLKAGYEKQSIIENDVPPLFRDFDKRKMKTSWYGRASRGYKFRTSIMPAYFASLKTQAMNGIKHRSYKIGIMNGYINGKLADPKYWKKTETLSDGCEVYESTVSLIQEYQSVSFYGSVERKQTSIEKDRKDYRVYLIKQPKDMGNQTMVLLGDVYRVMPIEK